jgi:hypothetical protein
MFLVSKYNNAGLLWYIYGLINGGLLGFALIFLFVPGKVFLLLPLAAIAVAVLLFGHYCYGSYGQRLRKNVDGPMRISLISVLMLLVPLIMLLVLIVVLIASSTQSASLVLTYGFTIFFGWITAIILGMTFKTLPFIVWNKVYHHRAGLGKTPNPRDLFSGRLFRYMSLAYTGGVLLFSSGILLGNLVLLQSASVLLLLTAVLYNWNVLKVVGHKPLAL